MARSARRSFGETPNAFSRRLFTCATLSAFGSTKPMVTRFSLAAFTFSERIVRPVQNQSRKGCNPRAGL
jgi:hypothetical protein